MDASEGSSNFTVQTGRDGGLVVRYKSKTCRKTTYKIWMWHDPLLLRERGTGCVLFLATYQIRLANSYEPHLSREREKLSQWLTSVLSKRESSLGCPAKIGDLVFSKKAGIYTVQALLRCSMCPLKSMDEMLTCDKKEKLLNLPSDMVALSEP